MGGGGASQNKFTRDSGADEQNKTRSPSRPQKEGGDGASQHIFLHSRRVNGKEEHIHYKDKVQVLLQ